MTLATMNDRQITAIGLRFVIDSMSADCPFGAEKIRGLTAFGRNERQLLIDELYNVKKALTCLEDNLIGEIRRALMRIKNIRNTLKKCEKSVLSEVELFEVKGFLLCFSKLKDAFDALNETCAFRHIILGDMAGPLNILDPDGRRLPPFSLGEVFSPKLRDIRRKKAQIETRLFHQTNKKLRDELEFERLQIVEAEDAEEMVVKKRLSEALRPFLPDFFSNMDHVGRLDLTLQKALLAKQYGAVCPEISDSGDVVLENMFNPYVADALSKSGKTFTPISITLTAGTTLLTGANMGGKTVVIKTALLNVMLCRLGFFAFAKRCRLPMFDNVRFISEDLQSIKEGLSTFGAEMLQLNDMAKEAKTGFLFMAMDELARGTNPAEGSRIVSAAAIHFNKGPGVALISTHYDNVARSDCDEFSHYRVAGLSKVDFDALRNEIKNNPENGVDLIAKHMDYQLIKTDGKTLPPRDALNVCRLLGLDEEILGEILNITLDKIR